ncbi:SHD1 domain-containing protein [Rubripirellula obstinata]|nr:SHD1 domain-containing protein [Rubripirellula obstinata]
MSPSYDMGMPMEMGTPVDMGSPIETPMEGTIVDDAMMAVPMADGFDQNYDQGTVIEPASPAPIEETAPMEQSTVEPEQPFDSASANAPPVPSEPNPAVSESAVAEPEMAEPAVAPEPEPDPTTDTDDDDLFGSPADEMPTDPMPADEPADDMNADDLFGGSDDTAPAQPMDSVEDDLFGGSSNDAPVEAETSMDDLFGDPPADAPVDEPAGGMDDLFGDPPADSGDAMPNSDEQPSIDDLFGDSSSQDDSNIESMVSEETSAEDLFGTPEPSDMTSDEIFDAPSQEASEEADSDFNIDDLFGAASAPTENVVADVSVDSNVIEELPAPADEVAVQEVATQEVAVQEVATQEVATQEVATQEVAVQVVSKSVMPTDALDETRIRTWIDNTGVYHVEGRLIEIAGDHVRLLKANGRTCTVPNSRLCQADAAYVDSIREQADSSRLAMLTSK